MVERVKSGTMITRLLELALSDPKYQEELERLRKPIVVMFTDIQGSTAYFEKHGDVAGLMMVHQCGEALRGIIER
ncbi:MAG TPA: hypothetical protein VFM10_10285, partial [Terriglobales bacterium]|nr:hypothetical protein [Terriglobales bacterium]